MLTIFGELCLVFPRFGVILSYEVTTKLSNLSLNSERIFFFILIYLTATLNSHDQGSYSK